MICMMTCFLLAMRPAKAALFLVAEERRHKKTFDLPQGGEETKAGRGDKQAPKRLHSHPVCGETVARATQPGT